MCGFIGYIDDQAAILNEEQQQQLEDMATIITHRGPDDSGFFTDEHIRFGFRRLSIIDLEAGAQPLSYENERYWIIFNGEVYNYIEIRQELEALGAMFQTDSDTETIIALYSYKGEKALDQLRGMFSFVIWDKQEKEILAARDPFGIKPFFYYEENGKLYFASEKKSILLAKGQDKVDPVSLQHYLTYQFVPEPMTMSESINKLLPGHYIKKKIGQPFEIKRYFEPRFAPVQSDLQKAIKEIQDVLRHSVNIHMRSDVPVGSFLSGGIDSTAVVALAREINPQIKTFTVGFEREGFSEIDLAKDTARILEVENIHKIVTPKEFTETLPKIVWHLDDPVADPALVPLYFVAQEARKHVKVVLSGEGSDELFGGYRIYHEPYSLRPIEKLPSFLKSMLRAIARMMPEGMKGKSFLERGTTPLEDRYIGNAKMFTEKEKQAFLHTYQADVDYRQITRPLYEQVTSYDDVTKMQYIDMHTWLRGDILVKADKMTMANSLELRVPFLDVDVFQVASKLAPNLKVTNETTKYALRKAMEGIIPKEALMRPKLGFPVPVRHWLKNEIYDWTKQVINESNVDQYIDKKYVLQLLEDHCQGKGDYSRKIWTVLIFMIWHQIFIEEKMEFETPLKTRQYV